METDNQGLRRWMVYSSLHIDCWRGALSFDEYVARRVGESEFAEWFHPFGFDDSSLEEMMQEYQSALRAAVSAGFDFRRPRHEYPKIIHLPFADTCELLIGYVFKQDDKGLTYIVVPDAANARYFYLRLGRFVEMAVFVDGDEECSGKSIYFLRMGDLIKIGVTQDVEQRVKSYSKTEYPYEPELLATCPGGFAKEKELHARFAHARVKGEWFSQVPELMQYIEAINTTGRKP